MSEQSTIRYGPGKVSYFNSEGYADPTAHQALSNIKRGERIFRPLVYIASPYSGDTERNIERARAYCRYAVDCGCIPLAPHLLLPQFMNDGNERELALFMDMVFLGKCCELWVFGYPTEGMQAEVSKAKRKQMIIRYFTEDCEEVHGLA